jgi:hypothetical protein
VTASRASPAAAGFRSEPAGLGTGSCSCSRRIPDWRTAPRWRRRRPSMRSRCRGSVRCAHRRRFRGDRGYNPGTDGRPRAGCFSCRPSLAATCYRIPVLMSPHQSALSLPRAGEMPGSAAQTDANGRGTPPRGWDASRRIHVAIVRVTTRTTPTLTRSPFTPAGPVRAPHDEQARLVYCSPTIDTHLPASRPLNCSCVLSIPRRHRAPT